MKCIVLVDYKDDLPESQGYGDVEQLPKWKNQKSLNITIQINHGKTPIVSTRYCPHLTALTVQAF